MKRPITPILILSIAAANLVSCSSVKTAMSNAAKPVQNLSKLNSNDLKMFKLRDLRSNTPPIVQVRPNDLQKLKTGDEHVLAWNRAKLASKRSSARSATSPTGIFSMPEDFDPADLLDSGLTGTYGVLPSLNPDDKAGKMIDEELPAALGELPSTN